MPRYDLNIAIFDTIRYIVLSLTRMPGHGRQLSLLLWFQRYGPLQHLSVFIFLFFSPNRKLPSCAVQVLRNFDVFLRLHNFCCGVQFLHNLGYFCHFWGGCVQTSAAVYFFTVTAVACDLWLLYDMFTQYRNWPIVLSSDNNTLHHNSLIEDWRSHC